MTTPNAFTEPLQAAPLPAGGPRKDNATLATLIVNCVHPTYHTLHVRFIAHRHGLAVWYGKACCNGKFSAHAHHMEFLPYDQYPEARIYDGKAWDAAMVYDWVKAIEGGF